MQNIILTADLLDSIQEGLALPWCAITKLNLTEGDVCLVYQDVSFKLVNPRIQRKKISDLEIREIIKSRVGNEIEDVITFLDQTGQASSPDTLVSLVEWDRLTPISTPLVGWRRSTRAIEDPETKDVMSHVALSKIITPLQEARDGDVVAISMPIYHDVFSTFDDQARAKDLFVVVKKQDGLFIQPNSECAEETIIRHQAWLDYGVSVNDWNTCLGPEASHQLTPYLGKEFTSTALFFNDFVVAVSTVDTKILAVTLPCLPDGETSDQAVSLPTHIKEYLENWTIWPEAPLEQDA